MTPAERVFPAIQALVNELAKGNFVILERDGRSGRLTSDELELAIKNYGRKLIALPKEAFVKIETYPLERGDAWAVDVPLWTEEEGESDLTLSLTAILSEQNVNVEIDDLHVL